MNAVRLIPVYICALILCAHFYRSSLYPLVLISFLLPFLLLIKKYWIARMMQIFLFLGAAEWIRTLYYLAVERHENNMPWMRLSIILASIAVFNAGSALLFQLKSLKKRYHLN